MAATVVPMGLAGLYLLRGAERQIILLFRLIGYIYYRQSCIYVFIIVNSKASYMYDRLLLPYRSFYILQKIHHQNTIILKRKDELAQSNVKRFYRVFATVWAKSRLIFSND